MIDWTFALLFQPDIVKISLDGEEVERLRRTDVAAAPNPVTNYWQDSGDPKAQRGDWRAGSLTRTADPAARSPGSALFGRNRRLLSRLHGFLSGSSGGSRALGGAFGLAGGFAGLGKLTLEVGQDVLLVLQALICV